MNSVNRQILLVKFLYQRGDAALCEKGLFAAGLAVSLFHDAIELLVWTIAKEVDAQVSDNDGLLKVWDAVKAGKKNTGAKDLPLKAKILELNKARIGFKHYGIQPARDDAARFQSYAEQFLNAVCIEFFDVDFKMLSLVDLIESEEVSAHLRAAEQALDANDAKVALEECAKAGFCLNKPLEALVPAISGNLSAGIGHLEEPVRSVLERGFRGAEESIRALRNLSLITLLGVPLVDFLRYRGSVPGVWKHSNGRFTVQWGTRPLVLGDAAFCIKYLTNYAIALQETLSGLTLSERDYFFGSKSLGASR